MPLVQSPPRTRINQLFCVIASLFAFAPVVVISQAAWVFDALAVAASLIAIVAALALPLEPNSGIHLLSTAFGISLALALATMFSIGLIYVWTCVFLAFAILSTPKREQRSWFRIEYFAPEIIAFAFALFLVAA